MDPFVEWKIKKLARLRDIPEALLRTLEMKVDNIIGTSTQIAPKFQPVAVQKEEEDFQYNVVETDRSKYYDHEHSHEQIQADDTDVGLYNFDGGAAVTISSEYGYRTHPTTGEKRKFHNGVDITLKTGENVYSIADGIVVAASYNSYSGNYISIEHEDSRRSEYAHLSAKRVKKGQKVQKGQVIGLSGRSGRVTGPHLHFIIKVQNSKGNWVSRKPTVEEMRLAVGGREISNLKRKVTSSFNFGGLPLTKRAVNVSIEPYDSIVSEAVADLESKKPGYFSKIKRIVIESGVPIHFGKVESDKTDTIFISLNKIKEILGSNQDKESVKLAIMETLAHEMGHLNANFQGGESPAENEAHKIMEMFNAKR